MVETTDETWQKHKCDERLHEAFLGILGPYRNVSVSTKMLHLKRPRLMPVLDSFVIEAVGGRVTGAASVDKRAEQASIVV